MTKKQLIDSLQDVPNDAEVYITEKWWYTDEVICGTDEDGSYVLIMPLQAKTKEGEFVA